MQPNELDSMDFPLVSIIIPNFNTARFVSSALKSCIEQTYTHWEAIIVDDASKDNSARIIADFASQDTRIKPIFLESNGGVANARNLALQAASGRFIAFLDADDVWEKHKLEYQVRFMLANDVALSYGDYYVIDEEDSILGDFIPEAHITFKNMLKTCQIGNSTAVYDANKCGKVKAGQIRQDYELWLSILRDFSAQKVCFAPPPHNSTQPRTSPYLAFIRIRKGSDTYNRLKTAKRQWLVYRQVLELSIFKSAYYFSCYIFYALKKRLSYFSLFSPPPPYTAAA